MNKRHEFLDWLLRVKEEEETSYNNVNSCVVTITTFVFCFSVLEILSYFLYLFKVRLKKRLSTFSKLSLEGNCRTDGA